MSQAKRLETEKDEGRRRERRGALQGEVPSLQDIGADLTPALSPDARLALPANAAPRTAWLAGLQRHVGNAGAQRALAAAEDAGRPARRAVAQRRVEVSPAAGESTDILLLTPLADGVSVSFRMQAVLDNGELSDEPPTTGPILGRLPPGALACNGPGTVPEGGPTSTATPTAVVVTPTQAATTRAGTASAAWPEPTAEQRSAILEHIRGGNGPAALTALWSALSPGLPLAGRITLERTDQPGVVEGRRIGRGAGATAMALAYVPQQPGCAGAPPDTHWQRHTADDLRALIQMNLGAIRGTPEQCLAQLYSTLMHEYTHVEQGIALGLYQGITFLQVGAREFLSEEEVPVQQRELAAALDEIDAYSAEIEQAGRTGLSETPNIRITVSELWGAYRSYFSRSGQQPDAAVAARVYRNIERGRELYRRYLRSSQATPLPPRLLQFALTLYDCPRDYDPSILTRFAGPVATGVSEGATPPPGP